MLSRVILFALLVSGAAHADSVALALNLPGDDAVHRDFAAGVVEEASSRWRMLQPQMDPAQSATCGAEQACLQRAAEFRGASHLLIVGIAALGARDFVVSIQVIDLRGKKELLTYSDVHMAGDDAKKAGHDLAFVQFGKLQGMPVSSGAEPVTPPPVVEAPPEVFPTWVGFTGLGMAASSVAVAGLTSSGGLAVLYARPPPIDPGVMQVVGVGGAVATAALFAAGVGLVVFDAYANR